jgi:UDP-N-acetylmuramoyl-tripeptide--D-alanyl-D-alanine ligase
LQGKRLKAALLYVIVNEMMPFEDERIIQVKDVLQTLQQLAKYHHTQFEIPFIAIKGSNGKTTTKELLHEMLSSVFITYTTQKNLNNHIGIPPAHQKDLHRYH